MPFLTLSFELGALSVEEAEAACFASGALAVTLVDAHDDTVFEPAPGEVRLWPTTRVQALFPEAPHPSSLAATLAGALGPRAPHIAVSALPDRIWEREWLKDFHARRFGRRLWICPHHETVTAPGACVVRLDPGLAFGTGTHPTTALCLEWLDAHLEPDTAVIDYGCGSGILGLAAVKLGARHVWGFDIDPQALIATHSNAVANAIEARVSICAQSDTLPPNVDLLLANILSAPLCALATSVAALVRPGGRLVLSGLMVHESPEVTAAYDAWFDIETCAAHDEWVVLCGARRAS
jgi:ribosomal protein L11 methyltransferase